jgi:hypothetical protein
MIWASVYMYLVGAFVSALLLVREFEDEIRSDVVSWLRCLLVLVFWPITFAALIGWAVITRARHGRL